MIPLWWPRTMLLVAVVLALWGLLTGDLLRTVAACVGIALLAGQVHRDPEEF